MKEKRVNFSFTGHCASLVKTMSKYYHAYQACSESVLDQADLAFQERKIVLHPQVQVEAKADG